MRFSFAKTLLVALAGTEIAIASSWFPGSKAGMSRYKISTAIKYWPHVIAYNKWHETELERWLSDHNVPYPTPADRKDLENLVKTNWKSAVESPYVNWDTARLQKQIEAHGNAVKKGSEKKKDALVSQVKGSWQDTEDSASTAYGNVRDWIFDR